MRSPPSNPNALLDYLTANRARLNIKEFKKLLKNKDLDLNAQDKDGNTALHLLVAGGGTFEYAQLLLKQGADVSVQNNKNITILDITLTQKDQPQLLLLILAQYKKLSLKFPECWVNNLELQDATYLINFQFPTNNPFGEVFKKIIDNGNFDSLSYEEISLLKQFQKEIAEEGLAAEKSGSGSDGESLPSPKKPPINFGLTDEKLIDFTKEFITNFGPIINAKFEYEHSKIWVMEPENLDSKAVALRNYLTNNASISDLLTILQTRAQENSPIIKPILETIDYEELSLVCSQKQFSAMFKELMARRSVKPEAETGVISEHPNIDLPADVTDQISKFLNDESAQEAAKAIHTILRPRSSTLNVVARPLINYQMIARK